MPALASLADVPAATISQVASQYSIPPAILQAVLRQADSGAGDTVAGLTDQALQAVGVDPAMRNDPSAIVSAAAAALQQSFNQYGDWQQALSSYLTGSPSDYLSPTSAVGGVIWSILGDASANPTTGMSGYKPSNQTMFGAGAKAFGNVLQEVFASGGVTTQAHINDWHEMSSISSGNFGNPALSQGLQAAAKNNGQDYSFGQCTYYAARSLGFIPGGLGNAMDWAHNAAQQGMTVNNTPTVGSAVVYGAGGNYSPAYGHVAVVTAVNPDGSFTVSEMNVEGQGVADSRTSTMAGVIGFIQPPPGTDMATAAPGLKSTVGMLAKPVGPDQQKQSVTGLPDAPEPIGPPPADVHKFAQQLKAAGVDPNEFSQSFPNFAAARRRLMQLNSDPSDYAKAVADLRSLGQPVTDQSVYAYLQSQPHPTYPELTAGAYTTAYGQATLHSVPLLGRTPHPAEVSRLAAADAGWSQMRDFYQMLGRAPTDVEKGLQGQSGDSQAQQRHPGGSTQQ